MIQSKSKDPSIEDKIKLKTYVRISLCVRLKYYWSLIRTLFPGVSKLQPSIPDIPSVVIKAWENTEGDIKEDWDGRKRLLIKWIVILWYESTP